MATSDVMPGTISAAQHRWIDEAMASLDRSRSGPVEVFRDRPWALVAHFPSADGRVWFKANGADFAYEANVLELIGGAVADAVLAPIAVDADSGWFLSDDGGPTGVERAVEPEAVIERFVTIQKGSIGLVDDFLAAGVPDRRPASLANVFDTVVSHPRAGADAERCRSHRPRLLVACELLDDVATITNGDVKAEHVFVGPPLRLYDWGDAVIAHPLVALASANRGVGHPATSASIASAWGTTLDADDALAGAVLGELIGAEVWTRDMPGVFERHPDALGRAVRRLADALESFDL